MHVQGYALQSISRHFNTFSSRATRSLCIVYIYGADPRICLIVESGMSTSPPTREAVTEFRNGDGSRRVEGCPGQRRLTGRSLGWSGCRDSPNGKLERCSIRPRRKMAACAPPPIPQPRHTRPEGPRQQRYCFYIYPYAVPDRHSRS